MTMIPSLTNPTRTDASPTLVIHIECNPATQSLTIGTNIKDSVVLLRILGDAMREQANEWLKARNELEDRRITVSASLPPQ